ncbi:MAG: hypothetical protein ACXVMS_08005 [Flavisolibacter sp.]
MAGYAFSKKVSFRLDTQWGLANIHPQEPSPLKDKTSIRSTGFSFCLDYHF